MAMPSYTPQKPGILTLVTIVSFLLSVVDVLWFGGTFLIGFSIATLSWLGGPIAGAAGTLIGGAILFFGLIRSLLSILLFMAAWKTWKGEPSGRTLHRNWAWITVVLDVLDLLFTFGMSPAGWWGLIYAVGVLYVMNQPSVVAYFHQNAFHSPNKPAGLADDTF